MKVDKLPPNNLATEPNGFKLYYGSATSLALGENPDRSCGNPWLHAHLPTLCRPPTTSQGC